MQQDNFIYPFEENDQNIIFLFQLKIVKFCIEKFTSGVVGLPLLLKK